jgi:hypothetical protein
MQSPFEVPSDWVRHIEEGNGLMSTERGSVVDLYPGRRHQAGIVLNTSRRDLPRPKWNQ